MPPLKPLLSKHSFPLSWCFFASDPLLSRKKAPPLLELHALAPTRACSMHPREAAVPIFEVRQRKIAPGRPRTSHWDWFVPALWRPHVFARWRWNQTGIRNRNLRNRSFFWGIAEGNRNRQNRLSGTATRAGTLSLSLSIKAVEDGLSPEYCGHPWWIFRFSTSEKTHSEETPLQCA